MPSRRISPEVGCSKPAIIRRVVVFPQPEGPRSEKNSPPGMWRSMPSTAVSSSNCLVSLLNSISRCAIGLQLGDVECAAEVLRRFARLTLSACEEAPDEEAGRDNEEGSQQHDRCDRVRRR